MLDRRPRQSASSELVAPLVAKTCAYCGEPATTDDHVVPSALYPPSKNNSRVQRITVDACDRCNRDWSNDEAHFRKHAADFWRSPSSGTRAMERTGAAQLRTTR